MGSVLNVEISPCGEREKGHDLTVPVPRKWRLDLDIKGGRHPRQPRCNWTSPIVVSPLSGLWCPPETPSQSGSSEFRGE